MMGRAVLRINAYCLLRMVLPVEGPKLVDAAFESGEGGMPQLRIVIEGENIPDTDDLTPGYRELTGLKTAEGLAVRAYVLEHLHIGAASTQDRGGAIHDSSGIETPKD